MKKKKSNNNNRTVGCKNRINNFVFYKFMSQIFPRDVQTTLSLHQFPACFFVLFFHFHSAVCPADGGHHTVSNSGSRRVLENSSGGDDGGRF